MIPNERNPERLDRLEAVLRAAHGHAHELMDDPPPANVEAIMARVHESESPRGGDTRFLWRFLSAASAAAAILVVVTLWNQVSPNAVALADLADSPITVLLGPSLLN